MFPGATLHHPLGLPFGVAFGHGLALVPLALAPGDGELQLGHPVVEVDLERHQREAGLTLVPLKVYFENGKAKIELAVARGKRQWDKRQAMAERDAKRETERAVRHHNRGSE